MRNRGGQVCHGGQVCRGGQVWWVGMVEDERDDWDEIERAREVIG